jgi:ribonuclease-3
VQAAMVKTPASARKARPRTAQLKLAGIATIQPDPATESAVSDLLTPAKAAAAKADKAEKAEKQEKIPKLPARPELKTDSKTESKTELKTESGADKSADTAPAAALPPNTSKSKSA